MCGIAGVVAWDEKYRITRDTLQRMSNAIAHRGPDGEGFFLNHEREITPENPQAAFAFRRLAVIDPDRRSMQPFTIGHSTLVFNGEIYNYRDLKSEISNLRPDYQWRTQGDAEVLLMSYDVWREKCVEHLNGMFAFAVWDEREKSLYLARDRMGQKPLYFAGGGEVFAFSSELGAMRSLSWVDTDLDAWGFDHYLSYGYTVAQSTIYYGASKLRPGEYAWALRNQPARFNKYFDPNSGFDPDKNMPNDQARSDTRRLVLEAVARQLVADVPLGCFLSGGADSSVIAAAMRMNASDVSTFSIGFDDPRYDETKYAAMVAKHLGTRHHAFRVSPNAAEDLPKLAAVFGEPFADSSALPTHHLARETHNHVKVALSGDGGDELFGGYDRYRAVRIGQRLQSAPRFVRRALASGLLQRLPGIHPKAVSSRVKRLLDTIDEPFEDRYDGYHRIFTQAQIDELRDVKTLDCNAEPESTPSSGRDDVQKALAADRLLYLPDDLLTKVDRCSMLHALEVRSPFMDHQLVQFAAGLTTDQLLKGGPKRMLREAFAKDLPEFVFKRKKMGFAVPIGEWFRGPLREMLRDNLFAADAFGRQHFNMKVVERLVDEHETMRVDHSQRIYALLMLELWWRWHRST
jgi:asparagine synthase (glutamine-hydrolysing)